MSANPKNNVLPSINRDIQSHSAWFGNISGLKAEKMLRGLNNPYLYILRKGENETVSETDYYVSFILPDLSIKHQPFVITIAPEGWYYENGGPSPAYLEASIDDVLHLMMHCEENQPKPFIRLQCKAV